MSRLCLDVIKIESGWRRIHCFVMPGIRPNTPVLVATTASRYLLTNVHDTNELRMRTADPSLFRKQESIAGPAKTPGPGFRGDERFFFLAFPSLSHARHRRHRTRQPPRAPAPAAGASARPIGAAAALAASRRFPQLRKRPHGLHRAAARLHQRGGAVAHCAHAFGPARAHAGDRARSGTPAARLDPPQRAARARPPPAAGPPPPARPTA